MSEHTPGPWEAPLIGDDHGTTGMVWAAEPFGIVATVVAWGQSVAMQTADAHLIAAAPDMLAELKRLVDVVGDEDVSCVEAVIAKAEGKP